MAYRDSAFTAGLGGGGNVNLPTINSGDYCAVLVSSDQSGDLDNATLTGFTRESVQNIGAPDTASVAYFERINCTGSEGATAALSGIDPANCSAIAVSFSGRKTTSPRSFLTPTTDTNSNASPISISGTGGTAAAGDDLIFFAALDPTSADVGWVFSQPTDFTEREDPGGSGQAWCPVYLATRDNVSAGATGAIATTATLASQSAGWVTFVAAIQTAAVPPALESSSPSDNATGVSKTANISLTFDINVDVDTGNVTIYERHPSSSEWIAFEVIPITDSRVSVSTDTVTINPESSFRPGYEYALQVAATCIIPDGGGPPWAGFQDFTSLSFTVAEAAGDTATGFVIGSETAFVGEAFMGAAEGTAALTPGVATETDTALALTFSLAVSAALETDTALARTLTKHTATGVSVETDTAIERTLTKHIAAGRADETDTAITRALSKTLVTGRADEADTALARDLDKIIPAGIAAETDTSFALNMPLTVRLASEVDTAFACDIDKAKSVGLSSETDTALACSLSKLFSVGVSTETDTSVARTLSRQLATGLSSETDTAFAVTKFKRATTGRADETDTALQPSLTSGLQVSASTETDTAVARQLHKNLTVQQASESDNAIARGVSHLIATGRADSTETSAALSISRQLTHTAAAETDTALELGFLRTYGAATETDVALAPSLTILALQFRVIPATVVGIGGTAQALTAGHSPPEELTVAPAAHDISALVSAERP